jgi:hypothetical protein
MAGMIGGGILAKYYLPFLFIPVAILGGIGLILSLFLLEQNLSEKTKDIRKFRESLQLIRRAITSHRVILAIFAVGIIGNFVFEGVDQYWQVLFSEIKGIDVSYFGLIAACGSIMVIPLVWFGERLFDRLSLYIVGTFVLIAVSIFISSYLPFPRCATGLVAYFALKELIRPALSTHLNRHYNFGNRAAFLSSFNMVCSIGETIAGVTVGILAGLYGVTFIFYFSAMAALVVPVIFISMSSLQRDYK